MNNQTPSEAHPLDTLKQSEINPADYIETAISLYRQDQSDYRGRRNEDQIVIAELASEEADEYFDLSLITVLDLPKVLGKSQEVAVKPEEADEADVTLGGLKDGVSLRDMRNAWRQLWVGMSVLTNRLHRDSSAFRSTGYPELFEMSADNKGRVIGELFNRFQDLNALRFGAQGSGVMRNRWVTNLDTGEPERVRVDGDKARSKKELSGNAARRGYTVKSSTNERGAVHPAGKMSPEEFRSLRKLYPEVDMDKFAQDVAFLKDVAKYYEDNQE